MNINEIINLKPNFLGPFNTGEECINFANKNGFTLSKKSSKYDKNKELKNFTLFYSRGGNYDNKNKTNINIRSTESKKTGCEVKWRGNKKENQWFLYYDNSIHNYELLSSGLSPFITSKLTNEQEEEVQILTQAGTTPISIKNILK